MIELLSILGIVWLHFLGDFVFQTNKMAVGKSNSIKWLSIHAGVYSLVFIAISPLYALVNGLLHWCVDYITSKQTSKFWAKQNFRLFFGVIGLDQAVHLSCLIGTYAAFKYFGIYTTF